MAIILETEEKVKEQVIKNTTDISNLKSNVKWIYQYGGVGGSGSGGGGTSNASWALYATLGGQYLNSDSSIEGEIILDENASNSLVIQINRPNGKTYYIDYIKYFNGSEIINLCDTLPKARRTLSPGNYIFERNNINIHGNGSFSIRVTCLEDNDFHTINYFCITNPISINLNYVTKINNNYSVVNTIDVNSLRATEGLYIEIDYTFYTKTGSLYAQILNSSLNILNANDFYTKKLLTERSTKIYLKLDIDYDNIANLGYHMFNMNFIIDENGEENIIFKNISCTIIPNAKYLQVVPANNTQIIYNSAQNITDNTYKFTSGIHGFNLTPYSGSSEITANKFSISCIKTEHNDLSNIQLPTFDDFVSANNDLKQEANILMPELSINISERITLTHQINLVLESQDDDVHLITLSFIMKYNNEFSNIEHFYIYVVKNQATVDWYKNDIYSLPYGTYSLNYYRNGTCNGDFNRYPFINSQYIQFRKTDLEKTLLSLSNTLAAETNIIHIGIQYSDINKDEDKILTIREINGNNITVYQNKVEVGSASCTIYIPKEDTYTPSKQSNYHLLSIVKHKLYGNLYSITVYIDGVIENSIDTLYNSQNLLSFTNIVTHKSNFSINLFEISYLKNVQITDNDVARYWYAYFDQFILADTTDQQILNAINGGKMIIDYMDSLEYVEGNLISVKNTSDSPAFTTIENIALNTNSPVILIDYDNMVNGQYDNFVSWFTKRYGENEKAESRTVDVYWSPGNKEFGEKINIPTNTEFYIEPQGSSTLNYSSKNLNLGIHNTSTRSTIPVFTPNFKISDTNSFLPETKFTLKTDIVDSSHSNNTSIGKFVNSNTTKFSQAAQTDKNSIYVNHVKNCLLGFPVLLFIRVRINSPESPDQPDVPTNFKFYYLGIYNFNLGRDSYFNMGYYPLLHNGEEVFGESLKNNDGQFTILDINTDTINYKDGLFITEIQGGDPHFDFSQYHESILFQGNNKNKKYMFGDYVPNIYSSNAADDGTLNVTDTGAKNKTILTNLVKNIAATGGLLFKKIGKNFGPQRDKYNASVNSTDRIFDSINQVPDFTQQWIYDFNKQQNDPNEYTSYTVGTNEMTNIFNNADALNYLNALIKYESSDENDQTEYVPWLDYRSLIEYYVICMVFGLVDSVQKNLNLKTWNAYNANSPATFYTAFYDMDTCLGRDNGGANVKYFAFSDYWKSTISNGRLSEISIYRDFYPSHSADNAVPIGYDIPSSYLFAIAKYARISGINGEFNNDRYPSANMIYSMWRNSELGNYGKGSLQNAKYFVENYFDTLKNIPASLINHNYRFKYLRIENNSGSYSFTTLDKKPFHGRGKYSVIEWLSNRLRLLDAYFNLAKINTKVQKYNIDTDTWSDVKNIENDPNSNDLSLNEFSNSGTYAPDNNNPDIYILSDIFGKASKLNRNIEISIQSKEWSPIVLTSPMNIQQWLVPEDNKDFTISIKTTGNEQLTLGGSQYWTYASNLGAFIEEAGITITSKYLTNIALSYATPDNPTSWVFNTPSVTTINLNNPNYGGTLTNFSNDNTSVDLLLNLGVVSIANSGISLDFRNNGFTTLDISGTKATKGILINSCNNFNTLIYNRETNISELNVNALWNENIVLSDFTCKKITIGANERFENASIVINNVKDLEILELTGNFKKITISNCKTIQKLVLPKMVESLIISNISLNTLVENSSDTSNNFIYNNETVDISYLTNLKEISFEGSTGFNKVNLPADREIKLLYRAFAETYIEYIDFGNSTEGILVLCDNADHTDCSTFFNTRFTLRSGDVGLGKTQLKFKVLERETSLANLFKINPFDASSVHNGTAQIFYDDAYNFIKNLINKEYVISLDYLFANQENIEGYYKNGGYFYKETNLNNPILNTITFAGYTNLQSIVGVFEGTKINFVDKNLFKNINITKPIDIINFIDIRSLSYIHINAFDSIKPYIINFLYDTSSPSASRIAAFKIYDDYGICERPIVHDLIFGDEESNIEILSGFNITNKYSDYRNLFTSKEVSVKDIHDVFTNLNQFTNFADVYTSLTAAYGLNEVGITNLDEDIKLYNAFKCKLEGESLDNLQEDDLIDISSFVDFDLSHNQFKSIQETTPDKYKSQSDYKTFDFYKKIYTYIKDDETIPGWEEIWSVIDIPDISNLFSKCVIYTNDQNYILQVPNVGSGENGKFKNVVNASGLFRRTTIKAKVDGITTTIGIKLDENSLINLPELKVASYMFAESALDGRNSYPFKSSNIFTNSKLTDLRYMFRNSTIIGNHKTYIKYNENNEPINGKETFYIKEINGNMSSYIGAQNYVFNSVEYNSASFNIAYEFIPNDLFNNLITMQLLGMFENSDFEGYMPSEMFTGKFVTNLSDFIKNCKILPQRIGETNKYVFINSNFLTTIPNDSTALDIFNFAILCGNNDNKLYIIIQDSITNNILNSSSFKFTGFNLAFRKPSKLRNDFTVNDANEIIEERINKANIHINIYYDTVEDKEGIPVQLLNNIVRGGVVCNDNLSTLLNGYIMKPETIVTNEILNYERTLIMCGLNVSDSSGRKIDNQLSRNAILPLIEKYSIDDMDNIILDEYNNFSNGSEYMFVTFKNKYYLDTPFIVNNLSGITTNINISMIDHSKEDYTDNLSDNMTNICNNYLLLLNNWSNGGKLSPISKGGGEYVWQFTANLYNNVELYDIDNNVKKIKVNSMNNKLFEKMYTFESNLSYHDGRDDESTAAQYGYYHII